MPAPGPRRSGRSWRRATSGFLQRVVPCEHLRINTAEVPRQLLGDVHGSMLAAGAADGDGEVAAVGLGELADAGGEEFGERGDHHPHALMRLEVRDHGCVAAVQMAQCGLPVRIGETAYVEYEIGGARDPVL